MRSKAEILKEHYGVETGCEAIDLKFRDSEGPIPPMHEWTKLQLPYEAAVHPGIPSFDEIEKGMIENKLTQRGGLYPVCRVGSCVVKFGWDRTIIQEAETMLFLQENSQVRTPKVYAVLSRLHNSAECYYLIMEFIEGVTLESIWASLDDEARKKISSKLANQIRLLRSVPSEGYYGRVNYQGWGSLNNLFRIRVGNTLNGPYNTYEDCISAMYNAAELRAADSDMGPDLQPDAQLYLSQFKRTLSEWGCHEPKLTHLDPKFYNVMVQRTKGDGEGAEDWEVVLIDWADCGWLPAWMQAVSFDQRVGLFDKHWNVDEQAKTRFIKSMSLEESYLEQIAFFRKLKDIQYSPL